MNLLMRSFRIDLETAGILPPLAFGLIPTCLRCGLIWMGDAGAGFVGSRGRLHRIIYIWQNGKSPRSGLRLLTFGGAYSGMLVSGVACTWGSGAGGSWTCTG